MLDFDLSWMLPAVAVSFLGIQANTQSYPTFMKTEEFHSRWANVKLSVTSVLSVLDNNMYPATLQTMRELATRLINEAMDYYHMHPSNFPDTLTEEAWRDCAFESIVTKGKLHDQAAAAVFRGERLLHVLDIIPDKMPPELGKAMALSIEGNQELLGAAEDKSEEPKVYHTYLITEIISDGPIDQISHSMTPAGVNAYSTVMIGSGSVALKPAVADALLSLHKVTLKDMLTPPDQSEPEEAT